MMNERTEQLITRRLDGTLDAAESLELDKRLIRSPDARVALEDSGRIDELARETFRILCDDRTRGTGAAVCIPEGSKRNGHRTAQYGLGAAAALLFLVAGVPWVMSEPEHSRPVQQGMAAHSTPGISEPRHGSPPLFVSDPVREPDEISGVIVGPRRFHEQIERDVLGVVDPETQNVYLLELETARNLVHSVRANY